MHVLSSLPPPPPRQWPLPQNQRSQRRAQRTLQLLLHQRSGSVPAVVGVGSVTSVPVRPLAVSIMILTIILWQSGKFLIKSDRLIKSCGFDNDRSSHNGTLRLYIVFLCKLGDNSLNAIIKKIYSHVPKSLGLSLLFHQPALLWFRFWELGSYEWPSKES